MVEQQFRKLRVVSSILTIGSSIGEQGKRRLRVQIQFSAQKFDKCITLLYIMTRIVIKEIIWDEWNINHIKKHSVDPSEVLEATKKVLVHKKVKNGRYLVVGRVGKRMLALILKREKTGVYYLVTARDAAKKEREKAYEKEK